MTAPLPWGMREMLAVLLISVGWYFFPVLGPLIGGVIAMRSPVWGVVPRHLSFWLVVLPIVSGVAVLLAGFALDEHLPWQAGPVFFYLPLLCLLWAFAGSVITTIVLATTRSGRRPA